MRALLLVLLTSLGACAWLAGPRELPPLPLLPPAELGQDLQLSQKVVVDLDGELQTFLAAWSVAGDGLDFVGLTPSGQRLMTLSYRDGRFAESYSPLLQEPIPGREVLSHLQLAHWPLASVREALSGSGWRLEIAGGERQFYYRDRLLLTIAARYTETSDTELPAAIRIRSHVAPYRLEVETLQVVIQ